MALHAFLPEIGLIREPVVLAHVGVGRTKWRQMVKTGDAPAPKRLSERVSVYSAAEIRQWIAKRCAGAGSMSAQMEEALAGDAAQGFGEVAQSVSDHSGTAETLRKALATITAQLALRGYQLHRLEDGSLLIARWGLTRPLADLDAARAFAEQVGAA